MTNIQGQQTHYTSQTPRYLDPKSDIVFKKIFAQHPALIKSFLNGILPLPEGGLIESIEYLTPEQSPRIPALKNAIVDVKCKDQGGRIFIVEMQMQWNTSFNKRLMFGTAKAFVQQINYGEGYSSLCPVYGLALMNDAFDNTVDDWFHHYRFTHVEHPDKYLEGMEIIFLELPKFKPQTFEHRKMGVLWLRFMKEININSFTVPPEFMDIPEIALAVELTQESAYSKAELAAYDDYLDAVRVIKTHQVDSFVSGKAEGKAEVTRLVAKNLLKMGLSLDDIAKATELTPDIIEQLN